MATDDAFSQLEQLILEYGQALSADTSSWTVQCTAGACSVCRIATADEAKGLADLLQSRGMLSDFMPPEEGKSGWCVVAILDR